MTFSDRTAWTLASGGITGSENFESFLGDTSFNGGAVALSSGMSIGTLVSSASPNNNLVDVPSLFSAESNVNGTSHARVFTGQSDLPTTPFISFSTAITAAGADFRNLNDGAERTHIELYSGATLISTIEPPVAPFNALRFYGFVADAGEQITEIRFIRLENDVFGIDDLAISAAAEAVPAPATAFLLGAAMIGLARIRRRT